MPIVCSNEGCSKTINKKDRKHHENDVCKYRKIKCTSCAKRVQWRKYDTHGCVLKGIVEDLKDQCGEMKNQMGQLMEAMKKLDERLVHESKNMDWTVYIDRPL